MKNELNFFFLIYFLTIFCEKTGSGTLADCPTTLIKELHPHLIPSPKESMEVSMEKQAVITITIKQEKSWVCDIFKHILFLFLLLISFFFFPGC